MKITHVEALHARRFLFAHVHTDESVIGVGESGAWGHLEASKAAIEKFGAYLVGKDPRRVEHHLNVMYRSTYFRGGAILGAISAIDIALWDIKGKSLGVPVHELLGGPTRRRVRVYCHVKGDTVEKLVEGCERAKAAGFTAVGHLNPFLDEELDEPYFEPHARKMAEAIENVGRFREAVGNDVDLCVEVHRRLAPAEAVVFGRGIEEFRPMFVEDPIPPDGPDAMASVARQVPVPIATGERLHNLQEFDALLSRGAVRYVRASVGLCGGISGAKKIAALAEARHARMAPHNPISPVGLAACLQLAAAIPNFEIQEYPTIWGPDGGTLVGEGIVAGTPLAKDGFLEIPTRPGIGVDLAEGVERLPPEPRPVRMRPHADGSVVDQ